MTDLAAQIIAALDRAEETAQAATPGPWDATHVPERKGQPEGDWIVDSDTSFICTTNYDDDRCRNDAAHVAANDPAHVLRLTTALREVVKLHAGDDDPCLHDMGPFVLHDGPIEVSYDRRGYPVTTRPIGYQEDLGCPTLRALASVWDVPGDNT